MTSYSNRNRLIVLINKKGNPIKKPRDNGIDNKLYTKKKTFITEGFYIGYLKIEIISKLLLHQRFPKFHW